MPFGDLPDCHSSFDPALYLHSESADVVCADATYSDDIEALNVRRAETKAEYSRNGTVIQHRAWQAREVFRSDDSVLLGK
jgi:hypothetical protein